MEPIDFGNLRGSSLRGSVKGSFRGSFGSDSNSIFRNNNIFNRSSRDEDDEEALKWAALEKLPTFDRLRKGLLFGANEVDIHDLGNQQSKDLVDRLVKVADEDNEKFLLKLRDRIDT